MPSEHGTSQVVQGHIEPRSGIRCGWSNGYRECKVPDCKFPECRCIEVKRERGEE